MMLFEGRIHISAFCIVLMLCNVLYPVRPFSTQMDAMQHLKEQLEQRTHMIEANIQRQQDELRQIQEELNRVQGQGLQVREPPSVGI